MDFVANTDSQKQTPQRGRGGRGWLASAIVIFLVVVLASFGSSWGNAYGQTAGATPTPCKPLVTPTFTPQTPTPVVTITPTPCPDPGYLPPCNRLGGVADANKQDQPPCTAATASALAPGADLGGTNANAAAQPAEQAQAVASTAPPDQAATPWYQRMASGIGHWWSSLWSN